MAEERDKTICPYCNQKMAKWANAAVTTWGGDFLYICYNDECDYYQKGWDHTFKKIGIKASYRHRYDPCTGQEGPFPVNSESAGKDCLIYD